ncbi:MAG: hypothetical protein IIB83_07435 [Bacteroidetes bacterium]|nr:hypothetical protein [Bacteroidota bacterium]MCH8326375.1 hypothetical protein [Bacteroidota bacterium]
MFAFDIIWSIVLLFAGAFIAHFFFLRLLKKQDLYKAITNFKISFAPIRDMIDMEFADYNFTIVEQIIITQESVYLDLMPLLSDDKRRGFQIAWEEYTCNYKKDKSNLLQYYTSEPKEEKQIKGLLNQRIKKLMSFIK